MNRKNEILQSDCHRDNIRYAMLNQLYAVLRMALYAGAGIFLALVSVTTVLYGKPLLRKIMDLKYVDGIYEGKSSIDI